MRLLFLENIDELNVPNEGEVVHACKLTMVNKKWTEGEERVDEN